MSLRASLVSISLVSSFTLFFSGTAAQQCWYPDGTTEAPDVACNPNAEASPCCNNQAFCLDNGLCIQGGLLSRGSCTDKTWSSPACAQFCVQADTQGGVPLQPCNDVDNTWACWTNNTSCLDDDGVFTIDGGNTIMLRPYQVGALESGSQDPLSIDPTTILEVQGSSSNDTGSSSSGTGSASGATTTITLHPSVSGNSNAGYTAGQMAGVGLGIGIPLLIALIAALVVILRQRKQLHREWPGANGQKAAPQMRNHTENAYYAPSPVSKTSAQSPQNSFMNGAAGNFRGMNPLHREVSEADNASERQELEGDKRHV